MTSLQTVFERSPNSSVVAPGVYDALTAIIAEQSGFPALYLSGASLSYASYGRPDIGYTGLSDIETVVSRIAARVDVPLIVDADHGFGSPVNVAATIERLEAAGAAAIQIEDQSFPKRCGHLGGKSVIPAVEMGAKIAAAVSARSECTTWIIARTDAIAVEGLDAALERAEFYLQCGADALFIEAPRNGSDLRKIATRFAARVPLVANMVDGGQTPLHSAFELKAMGFALTLFPGGTARAVARALQTYFHKLRESGDIRTVSDRLADFDALNGLLGLADGSVNEDALALRIGKLWQSTRSTD